MASYILLGNFTDQGVRTVKDSTKRAEAFKELARSKGATVKEIFWTLGQYDIVAVVDAPDDTIITTLGLRLANAGNVRTQTLRARGDGCNSEQGLIAKRVIASVASIL